MTRVYITAGNTLQHSANELSIWGNFFVGSGSGTGTYALTGSGATLSPQDVLLGYGSSGIINQTAGQCNVTDRLTIGSNQTGSVGTYTLSGGSLSVGGHLECGAYLSGTFNQSAGTVTVTGTLYIGRHAGAEGEYNLGGGTLVAPTVIVANAGNGEFNWTGGTLSGNSMTVGANGTLSVETDVQYAGDLYVDDGTIYVADGHTFTVTGTFGESGADGTITKTGGGTLVIQGTQDHCSGCILDVTEGKITFQTDAGGAAPNYNLAVTVSGTASVEFQTTQHLAALNLEDTSQVTVTSDGSKALVTKALAIDESGGTPTATLDLANNNLIIDYDPTPNPFDDIAALIKNGWNGGAWNGTGITCDGDASEYGARLCRQRRPRICHAHSPRRCRCR
ncbi:MAG: hypothetical protein R6X20_15230 [Phycisphaerae bacterium]